MTRNRMHILTENPLGLYIAMDYVYRVTRLPSTSACNHKKYIKALVQQGKYLNSPIEIMGLKLGMYLITLMNWDLIDLFCDVQYKEVKALRFALCTKGANGRHK